MALIDTAFSMLHVLFAGIWAGTTVFYAWRIHPLLSDGAIDVTPAMSITTGLRWLTRIGAVVFVVTGGHMAATGYGDGRLFSDPMGHAVLGMLALWFVVTGVLEVAIGTMQDELGNGRIQTAGRETETLVKVAATFSVVLLLIGGFLAQPLL
ncbi:MAG: transporter [Halolamina sp.]